MATIKNYYDILGVARDADAADIASAWREWRRDPKNHPDTYVEPRAKEKVEQEFQERSAAYLVLSDPAQRQKHDDELERAAGTAGGTMPKPQKSAAGSGDTAGAPDPGSEQADWGDNPAGGRNRTGYARPFKSYNPSSAAKPKWMSYMRLTPFLIAAAVVVAVWIIYVAVQPHPTLNPNTNAPIVASNSPGATATPNPTPSPSPTPSPTPSATPEPCPGGSPTISVTSTKHGVITGTISNLTSNAVQIGTIGFYAGMASTNNPPDWTDSLDNMSVSPSTSTPDVIQPGASITFTESSGWGPGNPPSTASATIDYPDASDQMQVHWSWTSLPSDCQQAS